MSTPRKVFLVSSYLLFLTACSNVNMAEASSNVGCVSTGKMPAVGKSGACPYPESSQSCPVTPSYQSLRDRGVLWPCPDKNKQSGEQYYGQCTYGSGGNPLCSFDPTTPQFGCCCPGNGCWTPPLFNWIIGVCKGSGCGGYNGAPSTQKYKNAGSQLVVNYAASYQWTGSSWQLMSNSSFNTNGSKPAFDTMKPNGGLSPEDAWMQPQPGGSAAWTYGYYPAGVKGVGPPGMMFVLSVESVWNVAWYMLNQVTLDKGPTIPYPSDLCKEGNDNCWASGNAGEIDFLEAVWTVNAGATDDYRRLYATQWNQVGRSFIGDGGSTCNADGGWFSDQECTNNYFLGTKQNEPEPFVFVAVVDKVGTFIYRIPSSQVDQLWPGLSRKTAACTLSNNRPTQMPENKGPPCRDDAPYCALFIPNCQAPNWGGAAAVCRAGPTRGARSTGSRDGATTGGTCLTTRISGSGRRAVGRASCSTSLPQPL